MCVLYGPVWYRMVLKSESFVWVDCPVTRSTAEEHISFAAQHAGVAGTRSNYWKGHTFKMTYLGSNFTRFEGAINIPQSFLSLQIFASNIKMTSVELCICVPFGRACGRLLCASGVFCNFLNPGQSL